MNSLDAIDLFLDQHPKRVLQMVDFDAVMAGLDLNTPAAIYLPSGIYLTRGFRPPKKCLLYGDGQGQTIIRTVPNVGASGMGYPHLRMIQGNAQDSWSDLFLMRDLTLDGNIDAQDEFETNGNFKIEPLVMNAVVGLVRNVEVVGFGANGSDYFRPIDGTVVGSGLESFPLCVATFTNGEPFEYFDWARQFLGIEEQTYIEVSNCRVVGGRYKGAGYATGIMVNTNSVQNGDRQPVGKRTTLAGLVRNNYVEAGHSIGYGCADSEMIRWEGNISRKTKCGFNCDTGHGSRLEIIGNQFYDVAQGINLSPSNGMGNRIDQNLIVMGDAARNPVTNALEPLYGIHTQRLENSTADGNTYVVGSTPFTEPVGIPETNARVLQIGGEDRTAEIDQLRSKLVFRQSMLEASQSRVIDLESAIKSFKQSSTDAEAAGEWLVGLVD